MKGENKQMHTDRETGKSLEHDFMFPNPPHAPVLVRAENIEEATKKFEQIISNKKQ